MRCLGVGVHCWRQAHAGEQRAAPGCGAQSPLRLFSGCEGAPPDGRKPSERGSRRCPIKGGERGEAVCSYGPPRWGPLSVSPSSPRAAVPRPSQRAAQRRLSLRSRLESRDAAPSDSFTALTRPDRQVSSHSAARFHNSTKASQAKLLSF
ncbi:hypothetical protein NDU88_010721 [Pleurodeles waltl]|uniref:Uncharacterized protein n=1 Tax=Pleurodeles waltl TaxID=8319 RepID=A0AAV7PZ83_PLEWA|nr:hypothetical protein NDU88_010721 [Pleurodeles waltl]